LKLPFTTLGKRPLIALIAILLLSALGAAQTLTGTVKNSTTGKPAAGDEVVLLSLGQGMEEAGRTKTDAKGHFTFKLDHAQGPHLVRVIHQEVTYHRMAPPGTTSVDVPVYDVSKKVEGIEVIADIMRFQAGQGQLQVERTFAVNNASKPPRTQMNEHNLEFYGPDGATITEGQAMTAGGQPVKSAPVPENNAKSRYAFLFPLRPGETRFSVVYTLPYTGSANIDPKSVYPLEHFVAIAPKAMEFSAAPGANYQLAPFPGQPDANVEVASNLKLGQPMAFKLSGEGALAAPADEDGQPSQGSSGQNESRPGGGLGPPIDAPDPLQKYRWQILGGFALVPVAGGVYVASRQQAASRTARAQGKALPSLEEDVPRWSVAPAITGSISKGRSTIRMTFLLLRWVSSGRSESGCTPQITARRCPTTTSKSFASSCACRPQSLSASPVLHFSFQPHRQLVLTQSRNPSRP
jgi:hypothetical protein